MFTSEFPAFRYCDGEDIFHTSLSEYRGDKQKKTVQEIGIDRVVVAVSMQYCEDGSIDITFLNQHLSVLSHNGIKTVLIAGTTGESSSLSHDEHVSYVKIASFLAHAYGMNVIAGAGSNSILEQNSLIAGIFSKKGEIHPRLLSQLVGISQEQIFASPLPVASLLLPPYYIKTSTENLIRYFMIGLNKGPTIIYSIKGRTGMEIPLIVLEILSKHPNFLGVKECDSSERISYLLSKGIHVWTGNDDSMVNDVNKLGAYGVISVTAGLIPSQVRAIIDNKLVFGKEVESNDTMSRVLFPSGYPNPHMIHNIFSMKQYHQTQQTPVFRLPVGPVSIELQRFLIGIMGTLGIEIAEYGKNYHLHTDE